MKVMHYTEAECWARKEKNGTYVTAEQRIINAEKFLGHSRPKEKANARS